MPEFETIAAARKYAHWQNLKWTLISSAISLTALFLQAILIGLNWNKGDVWLSIFFSVLLSKQWYDTISNYFSTKRMIDREFK